MMLCSTEENEKFVSSIRSNLPGSFSTSLCLLLSTLPSTQPMFVSMPNSIVYPQMYSPNSYLIPDT